MNKEQTIRKEIVLFVVAVGTLLTAMTHSIVNLALPSISTNFMVTIDHTRWVMLSFLFTTTVLLLIMGRLGDLISHKTIFILGYIVFGTSSAICGLSDSINMLIMARVIQGLGGAMIMATGPALLTTSFPGGQRGRALGMLATATYIGLTIGPPLGGFIISTLGWRWTFFINIPVVLIVLVMGVFFLPQTQKTSVFNFDYLGSITFGLGILFLLIVLTRGQTWGWGSPQIIGCLILGVLIFLVFVRQELKHKHPLLNLKLFKSYTFLGSAIGALTNYIAVFVAIILLPFYLLEALNVSSSQAGLILAAQPLLMAIVASPSGWLSDKIGSRWLSFIGMLILSIGLAGLSTLNEGTNNFIIAVFLAITGLGTGIFISPNSSTLMGSAPREQQGTASGIMAVARNLGMLIGITLGTVVFALSGGKTGAGIIWEETDYNAMRNAFIVAGLIAFIGAFPSLLKGKFNSDTSQNTNL